MIGGSGNFEGVLYAQNPINGESGPVCDDYFTLTSVSLINFKYNVPYHGETWNSQITKTRFDQILKTRVR